MQEKQITQIRALAVAILSITLYLFLERSIPYTLKIFSLLKYWDFFDPGFHILIQSFFILPILKIIVSYGLFRILPWARKAAIVVLSFDFLFRTSLVIELISSSKTLEYSTSIDTVAKLLIDVFPNFLISILSLIAVIILLKKSMRDIFQKDFKQSVA